MFPPLMAPPPPDAYSSAPFKTNVINMFAYFVQRMHNSLKCVVH